MVLHPGSDDRQETARRHRGIRGFTLIELLVVIAIIAVLASILVPVVNKALDQGKFMHCTSNIAQLSLGVNLYAADHRGSLPNPNWGPSSTGWLFHRGRMDRPQYVEMGKLWPYLEVRRIYRCASDPAPSMTDRTIPNRPRNSRMITSYCMNGSVVAYGNNTAKFGVLTPFLIDQFNGNDILFWEPDENKAGGWWWDGSNYPSEGISARHFDRASVANIDGSAHAMRLSEFYAMADPNPEQRNPRRRNRLYNVPGSPTGE